MTVITEIPLVFRFWDGEKMHYDIDEIQFYPELSVVIDGERYHKGELMQCITEQFDGDNPLYEGDIIESSSSEKYVLDFEPIYLGWVKWNEEDPLGIELSDSDKVIGNKFENPKLWIEAVGKDTFDYEQKLREE